MKCEECNEKLTPEEEKCTDLDGSCWACHRKYMDKTGEE